MLPSGEVWALVVSWELATLAASSLAGPEIPDSLKDSSCMARAIAFRPRELLLQVPGMAGTLLESEFSPVSPGPALSPGLSWDGGQVCHADSLYLRGDRARIQTRTCV